MQVNSKAKTKLSVKQQAFINEYIRNKGNATKAAIKAGYSEKTAAVMGIENLRKPNIKVEIDKRLKKSSDKKVAQADEVLELLTKFARGKVKEEQIVIENIGDYQSKAKIMEKKIANRDQLSALDKLARIHGLYNDKVKITTSDDNDDLVSITLGQLKNRDIDDDVDNSVEVDSDE
mgnify:CR=1 FL=1